MPRKTIVSGGAGLALLISAPMIAEFEGKRNDPYRDIVGIPTVCYGETRVPMKRYTDDQCKAMLTEAVKEFQDKVLVVNPNLVNHPYQLAAATSLAYNIGFTGYRDSSVARQFKAGNFKQACDNFMKWNKVRKNGVLVVSNGLDSRRKKERKVCLTYA